MSSIQKCAVVIPLFNGERWIEQALDSVFSQTLQPDEVLVVDDGSTDRSVELARRYRQVTLLSSGKSKLKKTRLTGISHARAPLIAFLDQDDLWHPEHLQRTHDALSAYPNATAAVGQISIFQDGDTPRFDVESSGLLFYYPWRIFPLGNEISTPSAAVMRRETLLASKLWGKPHGVGDFYLWLRLAERHPLIRLEATTVGRRVHESSLYQGILRDEPLARLNSRCEVAEEALNHLLPLLPDDRLRQTLQRRARIARELHSLARSLVDNDQDGLETVLARLQTIILPDEGFQWSQLFTRLNITFRSSFTPDEYVHGLHQICLRIADALPDDATAARNILQSELARYEKLTAGPLPGTPQQQSSPGA